MPIMTPCKGICRIHKQYKICVGCYRSRLEIKQWLTATEYEKAIIINSLEQKQAIYGELNGAN